MPLVRKRPQRLAHRHQRFHMHGILPLLRHKTQALNRHKVANINLVDKQIIRLLANIILAQIALNAARNVPHIKESRLPHLPTRQNAPRDTNVQSFRKVRLQRPRIMRHLKLPPKRRNPPFLQLLQLVAAKLKQFRFSVFRSRLHGQFK